MVAHMTWSYTSSANGALRPMYIVVLLVRAMRGMYDEVLPNEALGDVTVMAVRGCRLGLGTAASLYSLGGRVTRLFNFLFY